MANLITALDIGSSQIKGVVATPKVDGTFVVISVFKHPSAGFRKGVLVDVEEASLVLRDLAIDLQKLSKKAVANTFVSIQSEHVKCRTSRGIIAVSRPGQEIQNEDIERAIEASRAVKLQPNHLVLHNIVREFFVDDIGDIADPLGMTGNRLEVSTLVVEAFAPQINVFMKTLEKVGFRIGGIIFNPFASAKAVLTKRQRDLGVLLIDMGFGTTSFVAYEENKVLHAKSIPLGSGFVTNDIAIGLKTSIDTAEKLKTTYGFALAKDIPRRETIKLSELDGSLKSAGEITRRFLGEIIEIRLAEIFDLVNNELKALGRTVQFPAGAVVTGGGVKLAGMTELVKQELKLPVQMGFPNLAGFEITNPTHEELLDDPEFACAAGLLRWSGEEEKKVLETRNPFKSFLRNFMP